MVFKVDASCLEVIDNPSTFLASLKDLIESSEERILLSALYFGSGKIEQSIISCIDNQLQTQPKLHVTFLFDYLRSTRFKATPLHSLLPLKSRYPTRVSIHLYHTPDLRGWVKRLAPHKVREGAGLHHVKAFVGDSKAIIIGNSNRANLSEVYFTTRLDRYLAISDRPTVDWLHRLCLALCSISLAVDERGAIASASVDGTHPFQGNHRQYRLAARAAVNKVLPQQSIEDLNALIEPFLKSPRVAEGQTVLVPLMQCTPLYLTQDSEATIRFWRSAPKDSSIYLSTAYFNPTSEYTRCIIEESASNFDIVTASPKTHGFRNATGLSYYVPQSFTYFLRLFHSRILASSQSDRVALHEYKSSKGWSFHAKGVWYYPPGDTLPTISFIGSPNFGERSVSRDTELQFVVLSHDRALRRRLHSERCSIFDRAAVLDARTLASRNVPWFVRWFTRAIRTML